MTFAPNEREARRTTVSYETVLYDKQDGIATVTLNRPQALNAITYQMIVELLDVFKDIGDDDEVRVAVLKGAGRAFCAGDDLKGMGGRLAGNPPFHARLRYSYPKLLLEIRDNPKPFVAQCKGYAVGAGCDLSLACDYKIAAEGCKFGVVYVQRGLGGGGTYFLPKIVGLAKASEFLLLGDMFDAREAERLNIVNKVVPADRLEEETMAIATRFSKMATRSISIIKNNINQSLGADLRRGMENQIIANIQVNLTEDCIEGREAFAEKREPNYKGR